MKVHNYGYYLRMMARTTMMETHLQNIAPHLVVDTRKLWKSNSEEDPHADTNLTDLQRLMPYSVRKRNPLLPWQSYRDWLMLMVHYFDAADILLNHLRKSINPGAFSITLLSPPAPVKEMLPWTDLLKNEHFFPTLPNESSGEDFITFLKSSKVNYDDFKVIIREAQNLKSKLESDQQPPIAKSKLMEMLRSAAKDWDVFEDIIGNILFLEHDFPSEDRPAWMQTIIDLLVDLDGPLQPYFIES